MKFKKPQEKIAKLVTSSFFPLEISKCVTLRDFAILFVTFSYVTGYLVHAIFVRTLGITNIPLINAEYIETGLVFIILSMTIIFTPLLLWYIITKTKEHFRFPKTGSKRSLISLLNFTMVLLFFALFVTSDQWAKTAIPNKSIPISLRVFFHVYIIVVFFGILFVGGLQRFKKSLTKQSMWNIKEYKNMIIICLDLLIEIVRWMLMVMTIAFDFLLVYQMRWIGNLLFDMRYYFMMLFLTTYMLYRAKRQINKLKDNEKLRNRLLALTGVFSVIMIHLIIIAYSSGVYPFIPANRGGRLPVSNAIFTLQNNSWKIYSDLLDNSQWTTGFTIPLRVIEQTDVGYFVIKPDENVFMANVVMLKKEQVTGVVYKQIDFRK